MVVFVPRLPRSSYEDGAYEEDFSYLIPLMMIPEGRKMEKTDLQKLILTAFAIKYYVGDKNIYGDLESYKSYAKKMSEEIIDLVKKDEP